MEEGAEARYWCHVCSRMVDPIDIEVEIKCPLCDNGFVEEIGDTPTWGNRRESESDIGSDRALSLWAPILLGMMSNPRRRRRLRRLEFDDDDDEDENEDREFRRGGHTELDEIESIIRRRRRNSATILHLLQNIRAGMASEYETGDRDRDGDREGNDDGDRDREREHVIMINPFNQTIIIRGSNYDSSQSSNTIGSLGDYFVGPGLDMLLQHLAENDPNRYGTPPAQKEAVEAMPTVTIEENLQCSVCLDDFGVGAEAREMPCKHKFHTGCILPWFELHSSCPICRYQLPADESKLDSDGSSIESNRRERRRERERDMVMERERDREMEREMERERDREREMERERERESEGGRGSSEEGDVGEGRNGNGRRFSIRWPFHGFFSSSSEGNAPSSSSSSSPSAGNPHENVSQSKEN